MMRRGFAVLLMILIWVSGPALAQTRWVQIEAQPSLAAAQDRARAYASYLPNVAGFALGGGWYGIAIGPYSLADAENQLLALRRTGQIPRDSFLADPGNFGQQYWPIGGSARVQPVTPTAPATEEETTPAVQPAPPADETPREARRSEQLLTRDERKELQIALQWEGFYTSTIDGAFGRGTRNAMGAWQEANGHEATGVLTTKQRAQLIAAYNSVLDGLGLQIVTDQKAGISLKMPTTLITFDGHDFPFAKYEEDGQSGVRVVLISQEGGRERLAGLYDLMQTLEVVPPEGPRELRRDSFVLQGTDAEISSYTYAETSGGAVKGFTLVWPAGDQRRLSRVIDEMRTSFATTPGVYLSESESRNENQSIDLVSGLEIRTPDLTRSGFFVTNDGAVLTTVEAVGQCTRVTIGEDEAEADVVLSDGPSGIAVLKPRAALAPPDVAVLQTAIPRLKSEVAVAGYSYGGALGAPTMTYGFLADIRGLEGEEELTRLAVTALPGDAGGPVFDGGGAVLGMLLPKAEENGRKLPDEVSFALNAREIATKLAENGLNLSTSDQITAMDPTDLVTLAGDVTTTVSCWR